MGDTRYTRADLANVLVNVNLAAERLDMGTVYSVGTLGGTYLYLLRLEVDGTHREAELGGTVHKATVALLGILEAWHLVESARDECQRREAIGEHLPTD